MRWYKKNKASQETNEQAKKMAENLRSINGIKNIFLLDNNSNTDLLIECNFDSGDFLAIDNSSIGALKIASQDLEDFGFNPKVVALTKFILKNSLKEVNIWVASSDKKVLHWGSTTDTVEEWKQVRKESQTKTENITGISKSSLCSVSEHRMKEWNRLYEKYIEDYSKGCPLGWYANQNNIDKLLEKAIKL